MQKQYAFYGHHKCATTWMRGVITQVCEYTGLSTETFDNPSQFKNDLPAYLKANPVDFICYTNAKANLLGDVVTRRAFHMIRDPRDIIVSGYFSHKHSHPTNGWPELLAHREALNQLDEEQGLMREMQFSRPWIEDIASWDYSRDNILELTYEAFVANPYDLVLSAFEHLGLIDVERHGISYHATALLRNLGRALHCKSGKRLPNCFASKAIQANELLGIAYERRFAKHAKGRKPGQTDITSHYRKGQAGDWINHFTPALCQQFQQQYPNLLVKLGYEQDHAWAERTPYPA